MRIDICTIAIDENERGTIYYDTEDKRLWCDFDNSTLHDGRFETVEEAENECEALYFCDGAGVWEAEWIERDA